MCRKLWFLPKIQYCPLFPLSQFSFDSECGDDDVNMNNSTNVTNSSNVGLNSDDEDYEFATHVIKVRRSGQISGVQSLWELEGTTKITDYSGIQTVKMCPKDEWYSTETCKAMLNWPLPKITKYDALDALGKRSRALLCANRKTVLKHVKLCWIDPYFNPSCTSVKETP